MKAAAATNIGRILSILALLASTAAAQASPSAPFQWPDSSRYSRVIVNAQEGIESYPKEWFSRDTLVTDLTIADTRNKSPEAAAQQYRTLRDLLVSYGLTVGTYVSGTTAEPVAMETKWPWAVVPIEWMAPDSLYIGSMPDEPYRKIINVNDPPTRRSFQASVKKLWMQTPAPIRFIDNAAIHPSAGQGQPWASYCQNMKEIRELGEAMGSVQIFNVSLHVGELSDAEANQLIEAVGHGGILLEMPWHQNVRSNGAATERARLRFRQLLDAGMAIIMAEPGAEPSSQLVKWVDTWRKPADRLYLGGAFWKPPNLALYTASDSTPK